MVFCIAGDYWPHAAVAIHSTSRFETGLDLHLFYEKNHSAWRNKIQSLVEAHGNRITFHRFDTSLVEGFREIDYLGIGTYFRIFLPEIFPQVERILYLDSDLVVMGSVKPLLEWDFQGKSVAARPSCEAGLSARCSANLGREASIPYLNAGVLLINAALWRKEELTRMSVDFIRNHPERLTYADQCAINYVLNGKFGFLPPAWNTSHGNWRHAPPDDAIHFSRQELLRAMDAPKIIHYNGPFKPWELRDTHERKADYGRLRRLVEGNPFYVADDFPRALPGILWAEATQAICCAIEEFKKAVKSLLKAVLPKNMGLAIAAIYRSWTKPGAKHNRAPGQMSNSLEKGSPMGEGVASCSESDTTSRNHQFK